MQQEDQILKWIQENPMISQQELAEKAGITRSTVSVHISNLMKKGRIAGRGYVLGEEKPYVLVVGGVNMDIGGMPFKPLVSRDSNPGRVRMSMGGVGRNIAHNMTLLGMDVRMVTALGDDIYAQNISASCAKVGIDLSLSLKVKGGHTSTYLFITGADGEMELAVADMEIYDSLTPEFLAGRRSAMDNAGVVVADTNIPEASLIWLADNCRAPLFIDTVSTAKAVKVSSILDRIHTLKPNRIEAEMLSGIHITDDRSLGEAAEKLLEMGLNRVFISLGSDGVYAADKDGGREKLPCFKAELANTTGCGDAFMAGLVWSYMEGMDLERQAKAGLAASAFALEDMATINPSLSAQALRERAGI